MSERQTVQRWMITVGGVEQARVGAGQSVEIGRKPIRPLREDGFTRVDIVDNKRSMSKRHALLIVDMRGVATIRDLNSTNGTYLVSANGDLLRLEPNVDFQLPDNLMRMQFGDVPVDFVHVEEESSEVEKDNEVRNLFSYATDESHDEPAASDLSVDQILDLRAGEPTGVFRAQSVSHPGLSWKQGMQNQTHLNDDSQTDVAPINHDVTLPVMREQQETPVEPRNLFADAQAIQQESATKEEPSQQDSAVSAVDSVSTVDSVSALSVVSTVDQADSVDQSDSVDPVSAISPVAQDSQVDSVSPVVQVSPETNVLQNESSQEFSASPLNSAETFAENIADASAFSIANTGSNNLDINSFSSTNLDSNNLDINNSDAEYTPAFEPGSVFEKVSKGEFDSQENIVEAGGFTSKEAEESSDFSKQFEMAQYSQLLPFLAANTGLYDDLYAWLAAQGNSEVDAALARNSGYSAYRKAIEQ
ncbi:FHA domain-containing protein [Gardnerella sp. DNF01192]|uniref:variant leucine-rich repeat-containing protein n=1 Tax=Gardnerella sp. DNF01192 TaxID=2749064 RepID=UPI003BA8ACBA